jgi:hypothetical protein
MSLLDVYSGNTAAPVPAGYREAADAKAERDKISYEQYRAVDQQAYENAVRARKDLAVSRAATEARDWREDVEDAEGTARAALAQSRAAEDRAREMRQYAEAQRVAYEQARATGAPAALNEAHLRADAAEADADDAEAAAAKARMASQDADAALADAMDGLAAAERELVTAQQDQAAPPGTAPVSDATIAASAVYMQGRDEIWESLSDADRIRVWNAIRPRQRTTMAEYLAQQFRELQ